MFRKNTVFVLGAGASAPYGFSTGLKLLRKATGLSLKHLHSRLMHGGSPDELIALSHALTDNQFYSIDALLERRADLLTFGKRLISALILDEERNSKELPTETNGDWIRWVFSRMSENAKTPAEFAQNPVSFVTYNYDRLLEYRMCRGLMAMYGIDWQRASKVVAEIPIIHLHGTVGQIFSDNTTVQSECTSFGVLDDPTGGELKKALDQSDATVKIIHEGGSGITDDYLRAHGALRKADQIIFLGFGFGMTNVSRLRTDLIPHATFKYCATYDLTNAEVQERVRGSFPAPGNSQMDTGVEPLELFLRTRTFVAS